MKTLVNYALIGFIGAMPLSPSAANVTSVNHYATVENKPLPAQINPLLAIQQVYFSNEIKTIGQAMTYWLSYSGFHLAASDKQPSSLQMLMQQPLPQVDRHLGPLSVKAGLEVLAGPQVFTLTHDPLLREINFKLNPAFASVIKKSTRSTS